MKAAFDEVEMKDESSMFDEIADLMAAPDMQNL